MSLNLKHHLGSGAIPHHVGSYGPAWVDCHACKRTIDPEWKHCPHCGAKQRKRKDAP